MTLGFHQARSLFSLRRDSENTIEVINTCIQMYERSAVGTSMSQVQDLLTSCDPLSISQLTTDDGYNLLQMAVKRDDTAFVEYLLNEKKVNPNIAKCSLPLHVAVDKGSEHMVNTLLTYKARCELRAGMCYPQPHIPHYSSHSKFFFVSASGVCGGCSKDAYEHAIDKDNVQLLEILLQRQSSARLVGILLHYACEVGASQCVEYLIENCGADVNVCDNRGCNAIMHSLSNSIHHIEYLIKQGAEINGVSYQSQTVLHRLYSFSGEPVPDISQKTQLFLALGADGNVNAYDVFRNTAMSYLCQKYTAYKDTVYEHELRHCIDLLLVYNADVSLPDSDNCLPLHRLLQCPYHDLSSICCGHGNTFASCGDGVGGRINEGTGDERIGNSLQMDSGDGSGGDSGEGGGEDSSQVTAASVTLYELLQIFAKRDPKAFQAILNEQKETALFYLLRLYFGFGDEIYLQCIALLVEFGADINHIAVTHPGHGKNKANHVCDIHLHSLFTVVKDRAWSELCAAESCEDLSSIQPELLMVTRVLEYLYQLKLDPDALRLECRSREQAENVNALCGTISLLQLCTSTAQLQLIHQWLTVTLQWGADTQLQSYRPEPQICTSQGSIFLKHTITLPLIECLQTAAASHWDHHTDLIRSIAMLFVNTMPHHILGWHVNGNILTFSQPQRNKVQDTDTMLSFLRNLTSQPKSLQMLAQYSIYTSMHRRVTGAYVAKLPLPPHLKQKISQLA